MVCVVAMAAVSVPKRLASAGRPIASMLQKPRHEHAEAAPDEDETDQDREEDHVVSLDERSVASLHFWSSGSVAKTSALRDEEPERLRAQKASERMSIVYPRCRARLMDSVTVGSAKSGEQCSLLGRQRLRPTWRRYNGREDSAHGVPFLSPVSARTLSPQSLTR
jgi:hypothetical protein